MDVASPPVSMSGLKAPSTEQRVGVLRLLLMALLAFVILAIFPLTPEPAGDIKVLAYEVGAFVVFALWVAVARGSGGQESVFARVPLLPLVFVGLCLGTALFSLNVGYSLAREGTKLVALVMLSVVAADVFRTPRQVWHLICVLCAAVSVSSFYGILQRLGHDPFPWQDTFQTVQEAPATYGNPNFASHVLAPTLVLLAGAATQRGYRWLLLCLPLMLSHLAITRTRSSLLALAAAAALLLTVFVLARTVRTPSKTIVWSFLLVLLVTALGLAATAVVMMARTGQPYPSGLSLTLRYHSFEGGCRMAQDSPLVGHGLGMYRVIEPEYWTSLEQRQFAEAKRIDGHVHNEPLEFAAEAGVPTAIVYLAMLLIGICRGLWTGLSARTAEERRLGFVFGAFFAVFLVDGFFGFNAHVPASAVLLFLFVGIATGFWHGGTEVRTRSSSGPAWRSLGLRTLVVGCAAVVPVLGVREFSAQFLHQRGCGAVQHQAFGAADAAFGRAAVLAPYQWAHPYQLGLVAVQNRDLDRAVRCFGRALDLNPNDLDAQFKMAETSFDLLTGPAGVADPAALEKVAEGARRATRLNPLSPEAHDLLGRISYVRAQWIAGTNGAAELARAALDEAELHLIKAVDCEVKNRYQVWNLIALVRMERGNPLDAQGALIESIEDKPETLETWRLLLRASRESGRYDVLIARLDRRIEALNAAKEATDELIALRLLQATADYASGGEPAKVEEAFLRLAKERPDKTEVWASFHAFAKSAHREDMFVGVLSQAAVALEGRGEPGPPALQAVVTGLSPAEDALTNGVALLSDAVRAYQSVPENGENVADAFAWAVDVLAVKAESSSLSPKKMSEICLALGLAYGACQDYEGATRLLDRALPALYGEQRLMCLLRKAAALAKMGKTKETVKTLELATAGARNSVDARYALAQALVRDGQGARAREEYKRILDSPELTPEGRRTIQQEFEAVGE